METVEEGQNQPKIYSESIKLQEIVEKGIDDRIGELPDCLLIEILSRLPSTKEAITTGTLSKRWKHLWTLLPNLKFINCNNYSQPWSDFLSLIDKTLTQCRRPKLKKFEVYSALNLGGSELQANNFIRYAISHNVEELSITLWNMKFEADFFVSSCFTHLCIESCKFNPTGAISWKNLRSLAFHYVNLDDHLIENILAGSPQLETLELGGCGGYSRLDITSKSVKNLKMYYFKDNVQVNAPNMLSLTIKGYVGWGKFLLVNVSSLVEANLEYFNYWCETLKVEEEMLKGDIQNLSHVKVLKIGANSSKVLSRLEAKGFVIPSNISFRV